MGFFCNYSGIPADSAIGVEPVSRRGAEDDGKGIGTMVAVMKAGITRCVNRLEE